MLFFSTEQLQSQGVPAQEILEASQIQCSGRVYNRVSDFDKTEREAAAAICRNFLKEGVFGFICETIVGITVWREAINNNINHKTSLSSPNLTQPVQYDILRRPSTPPQEPKQSLSYQTSYEVFIRQTQDLSETSSESQEVLNYNNPIQQDIVVQAPPPKKDIDDYQVDRGVSYEKTTEKSGRAASNTSTRNAQKEPESKKVSRIYRGISY